MKEMTPFLLDWWYKCIKNPGHPTFIPVREFQREHLPLQCQTQEIFDYVKFWSNFVVKVTVRFTSLNRPNTYPNSYIPYPFREHKGSRRGLRMGSGMIDVSRSHHIKQSCPCPICKHSGNPKEEYWTFIVHTATLLVYNDEEARHSTFQCFYDSEYDLGNNKLLYGTKLCPSLFKNYKLYTDRCQVLCITHDDDLVQKLFQMLLNVPKVKDFYKTDVGVLISHPHGCSKMITVGRIHHIHVKIGKDTQVNTPIEFGNGEYRLPSEWIQTDEQRGNSVPLQAGTHTIPTGMSYVLPEAAKYCHRFEFLDIPWFTFPPGITFLYNGNDFLFPSETTFSIDHITWPFLYITYDVDTCPGCPGAPMLMDWGGSPLGAFRHMGRCNTGINTSGNQFYLA